MNVLKVAHLFDAIVSLDDVEHVPHRTDFAGIAKLGVEKTKDYDW